MPRVYCAADRIQARLRMRKMRARRKSQMDTPAPDQPSVTPHEIERRQSIELARKQWAASLATGQWRILETCLGLSLIPRRPGEDDFASYRDMA